MSSSHNGNTGRPTYFTTIFHKTVISNLTATTLTGATGIEYHMLQNNNSQCWYNAQINMRISIFI